MKSSVFKMIRLILIFMVIIFAIIFAIKYTKTIVNERENDDIKTEMLLLQAKIKLIKGEADVNGNTDNYVGTKVTSNEGFTLNSSNLMTSALSLEKKQKNITDIKNFLIDKDINEEELPNYYILGQQDIETMQLSENIKNAENYNYIVNYETAEVIYIQGIEINGKTKYKLSEILNQNINWILYNEIVNLKK